MIIVILSPVGSRHSNPTARSCSKLLPQQIKPLINADPDDAKQGKSNLNIKATEGDDHISIVEIVVDKDCKPMDDQSEDDHVPDDIPAFLKEGA